MRAYRIVRVVFRRAWHRLSGVMGWRYVPGKVRIIGGNSELSAEVHRGDFYREQIRKGTWAPHHEYIERMIKRHKEDGQ